VANASRAARRGCKATSGARHAPSNRLGLPQRRERSTEWLGVVRNVGRRAGTESASSDRVVERVARPLVVALAPRLAAVLHVPGSGLTLHQRLKRPVGVSEAAVGARRGEPSR
jgi:hypothetical protein